MRAVDWSVIANNYRNYPHNMDPVYNTLEEHDVFGDIPYNYMSFIEEMMTKYSDALFFLSTRDESDWLESVKRHRSARIEGVSNLITKETLERVGVCGSTDSELKASYLERNSRVISLFKRAKQGHRLCTFSIDDSRMKGIIDQFLCGHGFTVNDGAGSFPWEERTKS